VKGLGWLTRLNPKVAEFHFMMGVLCEIDGEKLLALKRFDKCLELDKGFRKGLFNSVLFSQVLAERFPKEIKVVGDSFEDRVESGKKIKTLRGEFVQSRGECLIADFLFGNKIDYDYDEQITLEGKEKNARGFLKSWIRPDFYLTEFDLIIEYWGLKGSPEYDVNMVKKKRLYKEAGKKFISISPDDLSDLSTILKTKLERNGGMIDNVKPVVKKVSGVKKFKCKMCGRSIRQRGNCYPCNIKRKRYKRRVSRK
tara:strand:- start:605 stop:1366 length:762 start_codon:yes stop_codon:yes gene_type:complete